MTTHKQIGDNIEQIVIYTLIKVHNVIEFRYWFLILPFQGEKRTEVQRPYLET